MLNIDLSPDIDIRVLVSTTDISVSRIGEIILLGDIPYSSRDPWEDLIIADEFFISSGIYTKLEIGNQLSLLAKGWNRTDLDKIIELEKQKITLALIQHDGNNLYASLCTDCTIVGDKIDGSELRLSFCIGNSEMLYNR